MRFCDFFIEYKIEISSIKSTIPWSELPFYRKLAVILIFVTGVTELIFYIMKHSIISLTILSIAIISIIFFISYGSLKKNQRRMLDEHYVRYSQKRMEAFLRY